MSSPPPGTVETARFGPETAAHVRAFFGTEPTPLVPLRGSAAAWRLAGVYIKDESKRLGQQAFKVFGGAYGMACWMSKNLGVELQSCGGIEGLRKTYLEKKGGVPTTFVTCTDGNHGRAVAWAAKQLGQKAVVYMPKGSAQARVDHITGHGAECTVTEMNYDDCVKFAAEKAKQNGWVYFQDTTGPDYFEIPGWIMQGYTAMADEAIEQIKQLDEGALPTHVLLQVGVGSMAGAVLGYLVERFRQEGLPVPVAMMLEPENAACAYESAKKGDGSTVDVEGDLESMIAGLCCGVLSDIGWPILWKHVDGAFVKIADGLAGNGMRLLKSEGVEAGECGGAGVGFVRRLMLAPADDKKAAELRRGLGLGPESRVLIFNTEGATDPANYEKQLQLPDVPAAAHDFEFVLRRLPETATSEPLAEMLKVQA
ncbi:unnamed protein product [Polarella glacialis]|uniref:Tryptophan synthase beta chain-like PALP domain-containing protein n=1 Tax=Polarella glacialis TaxID=89957 RepID=A0A813L065_POLGL|nr:unnamed protein product [Polarella glacialis]